MPPRRGNYYSDLYQRLLVLPGMHPASPEWEPTGDRHWVIPAALWTQKCWAQGRDLTICLLNEQTRLGMVSRGHVCIPAPLFELSYQKCPPFITGLTLTVLLFQRFGSCLLPFQEACPQVSATHHVHPTHAASHAFWICTFRFYSSNNLSLWKAAVEFLSPVWVFVRPLTAARQACCPSASPGACPHSRPSSQWCHPTISSSVVPFSSCLQSFPASGSFSMSQLFASGGRSIGASASASVIQWIFRTDFL